MFPLRSTPPTATGAIAAAGTLSAVAADQTAKLDAAAHALAARQRDLAPQRLDGDASTSADRDADGWNGGAGDDEPEHDPHRRSEAVTPGPGRLRLPDDPRGGSLDVTV